MALVTGSSRGIGRATALLFAERGYDVAIHYRREAEAAEAVAKEAQAAGADTLVVQGDLVDGDVPGRIIAEVGDRFGRLDVLVANAASTAFKPLQDVGPRHLDLTMRTVVQSFLLLAQGAVPLMAGRPGSIVAVSGFDSIRVVRQPRPPRRGQGGPGAAGPLPGRRARPRRHRRQQRAARLRVHRLRPHLGRSQPSGRLGGVRSRARQHTRRASSPPKRSPRSSPSSAAPPDAASAATT